MTNYTKMKLDSSRFTAGESRLMKNGSAEYEISISPFDIPQYSKSYKKDGFAHIDFEYSGYEDIEIININNVISLKVGKNSKRLYGITFDLRDSGKRVIDEIISGGIDKAISQYFNTGDDERIRLNKKITNVYSGEIEGALRKVV